MSIKAKTLLKSLLYSVIALMVFYAILSAGLLYLSLQHAMAARSSAEQVLSSLEARSFERAFNELSTLSEELTSAQDLQHYSAWIVYLPYIGTEYRFYRDVLSAGQSLSASVLSITHHLTEANIGQVFSLESLDFANTPAAYLEVHQEVLTALDDLKSAANEARNLHLELLPEDQRSAVQRLINQLIAADEHLAQYRPLIDAAPFLFGKDDPQEILFLLQNPHELRPTGGFIGTIGRLDIKEGVVSDFYTDDVYNVDVHLQGKETLEAPQPIQEYAGVPYWYLRDANWSPDFPTSAQRAIERYETATSESNLDTVVAITPFLIEELLRITGPIEVDGINFTEDNLIDAIQFRVEQEFWRIGLEDEQRKIVINNLAQALKQRLFNLNKDQMQAFFQSFVTALDRNEILVYTTQPELENYLITAGWAGEMPSYEGDYWYVVDANLGALKTDRLVDRSREYSVIRQDDGTWKARLLIRYKNNGHFDYRTTRYRTYTRIYVPLGSELLSSSGFVTTDKSAQYVQPTVYEEFNKTVFAGFLSIEPGQERFALVEYTLPLALQKQIEERQTYRLYVQKQPGASPAAIEVSLQAGHPLFSFAPSSIPYEIQNTTSIKFTDQPQADKEYILKFKEE